MSGDATKSTTDDSLKNLSLKKRGLTTFPGIAQAEYIETLDLSQNQLTELPPEICKLISLKTLDLGGNQLTTLPPEIGQLRRLQKVNLSENSLIEIPPEVGELVSLLSLDLRGNQLTALPPEISKLRRIQRLDIRGNHLSQLPHEVAELTSLRELDLRRNQLTELPREIGGLVALLGLDVGDNQLTGLPREIFKLTRLQTLKLQGNQLTELPTDIGKLGSLQQLDLQRNKLNALPWGLATLLFNGLSLHVSANPLREPFPELLGRGPRAVAAYLRSLEDAMPQFEAKLLLIGEGNVGKTSLVAAIRGEPFIENRPTTHGIEIRPLTMPHPEIDVNITMRAWDFGGQEVYRITHQFFFSRRALYLLVWNAREGQEQNEVEGWIRRIRLRVSRDAKILVVATHCDERRPELDYTHFKQAFPELLVGRHDVDNLSGRGISDLRKGIAEQAADLPQMGQLISPRWIAVRDEILRRATAEPQISYRQFTEVCSAHGVDGDEIVTLAQLMHDLGLIIYYADDEGLREFVILNPEWLTKAISYVLADEPTRESGGVLDHARLGQIWPEQSTVSDPLAYSDRYYPYFLRLMEKFDVSYRLADNEYRSLVAQLVPYDRPDLPWDFGDTTRLGFRKLTLVCQLSEPVPGLIAWLTVRHHRASTGRHWRNGVFLRHPIHSYASEALVELRSPTQLVVEVRAPSPDYFYSVMRDSIEDLMIHRWPGLTFDLFIPCPGQRVDGSKCISIIPMEGLLGYREEGESYFRCMECRTRHDVSELITGFGHPELALQPELDRLCAEIADVRTDLKAHAADSAASLRRILGAVGEEIIDCPRLFTLTHPAQPWTRRPRLFEGHYNLVLWCEHPGNSHPWAPASYSIDPPRDWVVRISPYAKLVVKALQLVLPVAEPLAGLMLSGDQLQKAQSDLQLMSALLADIPKLADGESPNLSKRTPEEQLTHAQGQAMRALRTVIFQHDPAQAFGDLRRVLSPSGDFLWVCPEHYSEYDPGLPPIPELTK